MLDRSAHFCGATLLLCNLADLVLSYSHLAGPLKLLTLCYLSMTLHHSQTASLVRVVHHDCRIHAHLFVLRVGTRVRLRPCLDLSFVRCMDNLDAAELCVRLDWLHVILHDVRLVAM